MPHYPIQTNLTAGELSPRMALRVDFAKYANGVETLENYVVLPQGGVTRAPGTRFVAEVKDSTLATRLIPFEFSTTQAYMLEFGHLYIRVYRDGGRIGSSITGAINNGVGLIRLTSTAHGLVTGDTVYVANVGGVPNATGAWAVTVINANTFDLVASTWGGAYTSGGTWVVEVVTNYVSTDLFDLKYVQTADVLYIVHPSYPPTKISRFSHTTWTHTAAQFVDGPYFDENLLLPNSTRSTITITPSAATGAITLTASAPLFTAAHPQRVIRLLEGSTWGYGVVTGFTSSTVVNFTVINTLTNVNAKSIWRFNAWYTGNYPGAICFFEERLAFAGSVVQPQAVWLSVTGDYEDMTPGVDDDAALTYVLASRKVNAIVWLADSIGLVIGTVGGEFALFGGNDSPLTPTNVTVRKQSNRGSLGVSPVEVGNSLLFVQRAGRKIRELNFNAEAGAYKSPDLTLLAEHITADSIVEMSYQQEPDSIVWCVLNTGDLVSFAYNPEQEVLAFGRRITQGSFESVATIPHPNATGDQTWVIVDRTINGVGKRYVEYMDPSLFVDCGLTYTGPDTSTVTGLTHLEAKTVDIVIHDLLADPISYAVYPQEVVSAGSVTLDGPAAPLIDVGLHYTPRFVSLRPEVKMHNGGTSQGRKKRWVEVFVRLYKSLGLTINDDEMPFRTANDPMDQPPPLFTGDKRVTVAGGWNREGQLTIVQNQPLPSTILGYFGTLDVGENSE
jgi:hypothetical protein